MEIIQIFLSLFFSYFALAMSISEVQLLLNCSLQNFLKENILIKHIIIFMWIFISAFVLGLYKFDSLKVETFSDKKKIFVNKNILWQYFKSTLLIYIIFIISTNNEGIYIIIFLISCLCLTLLQVYIKSINKDIHKQIYKNSYINQSLKKKLIKKVNDNNINDFNKIVFYHNLTYIWFIIILLILFVGMYKYYLKQKKTYKTNWKWTKFLFGNNYCKGIKY